MGVGSIVAAVAALVCGILGFFLFGVPVAGMVLSFAAPVLATAGLIIGGMAWSQAKQAGVPTTTPIVGSILSALVLLPTLVIALTCGLCNACYSAALLDPNGQLKKDFELKLGDDVDASVPEPTEPESTFDPPPLPTQDGASKPATEAN